MKKLVFSILGLILLVACNQSTASAPPAEATQPLSIPSFISPTPPSLSHKPSPLSPIPSPLSPSPSPLPPSPAPLIHVQPGPFYETVLQLPVGVDGIAYRGLGMPEMQVTGPNALAVLPDGSFIIANPVDNSLLRYQADGNLLKVIDLYELDILNVSDLVSTPTELHLLEISFNVPGDRYRVNRLSFDGELIAQYDLPLDRRFENGLYGLAPAGSQGEILLEFYGEAIRYFQLTDPLDGFSGEVPGIPAFGHTYQVLSRTPGLPPALQVGDLIVESPVTMGGLIKLLSANPDGTFYVLREDMVADLPVITADITIHFLSPRGEQIGVARYPIAEWLYFVQRNLAIGPDGEVYALLPRTETLDILRLIFYPRLDPLVPEAVEPLVQYIQLPDAPPELSYCRDLSWYSTAGIPLDAGFEP